MKMGLLLTSFTVIFQVPEDSARHTEGVRKYLLNDRAGGRVSGHLYMAGERWPAFFFFFVLRQSSRLACGNMADRLVPINL